jgi:hypothetical protein
MCQWLHLPIFHAGCVVLPRRPPTPATIGLLPIGRRPPVTEARPPPLCVASHRDGHHSLPHRATTPFKRATVTTSPAPFSSPNRTVRDPHRFPLASFLRPATGEPSPPTKSEPPLPFFPHRGEPRLCLFSLHLVVVLSLPSTPHAAGPLRHR